MSEDKEKETLTPENEADKTVENEKENEQDLDPKSLLAQKKHFKEKYEKVQKELEELKNATQPKEDKSTPPVVNSADDGIKKELETIKFTVANKDLDAENVAEIVDYAKGKGISLEDAKNSPVIQAYLKAEQEKKSLENASPDGNRSPKTKTEGIPTDPKEHEKWVKEKYGLR